jgi:long-chain acyl-CoA synthetase
MIKPMTGERPKDPAGIVAGATVTQAFLATVAERSDQVALRWRDGGGWSSMTFAALAGAVARAAGGLRALGVQRGDRVVLMLRNVAEFHVADLAVVFLGATPVSIYNSSSAEQVAYLTRTCGATVAIAETPGFVDRFLEVRGQLPRLGPVVAVRPSEAAVDQVVPWATVAAAEPVDLAELSAAIDLDDLVTVIFTSGTTGPPKGVMISHRNVAWVAESIKAVLEDIDLAGSRVVSYLPMAHIAERAVSHYDLAYGGLEVTCCPDSRQLPEVLVATRPHILFGVPRVWEKLRNGVLAAVADDPERAKLLADGIAAAGPIAEARRWGWSTPEQDATWDFLQDVAFRSVRERLGLDQVVYAVSGAAPLQPDTVNWFQALGVPLSEIYGLSETTGPHNWAPIRVKAGTVGPPIPGAEVSLAPDGEVLLRGGNIFAGYLDDPVRTAEAVDPEGWLHTGDIGTIDEDDYLRIVDRKKELIITQGGKNVSPANLESALRAIPLVGQACVVGDRRPFIAALVTLDPDAAGAWAAQHDLGAVSLVTLAAEPELLAEVDAAVREVMTPFNHAEEVKKVTVLGEDWQPDSDELTPTSKLRRRNIETKYASQIEALYAP